MSASEPKWSRLDNAAKIFPSTSSKKDPKVFRFSCELTEPVDGQTLQFALDQTMEKFPFYRSVLKRGLFWYYFEDSTRRPVVQPEGLPPCAPVYSADRKGLLFRVSFFERRINLEVYMPLRRNPVHCTFCARWFIITYWSAIKRIFPAAHPF